MPWSLAVPGFSHSQQHASKTKHHWLACICCEKVLCFFLALQRARVNRAEIMALKSVRVRNVHSFFYMCCSVASSGRAKDLNTKSVNEIMLILFTAWIMVQWRKAWEIILWRSDGVGGISCQIVFFSPNVWCGICEEEKCKYASEWHFAASKRVRGWCSRKRPAIWYKTCNALLQLCRYEWVSYSNIDC